MLSPKVDTNFTISSRLRFLDFLLTSYTINFNSTTLAIKAAVWHIGMHRSWSRSSSTLGLVGTGMGDCSHTILVFRQPPGLTQPGHPSGIGKISSKSLIPLG